MRTTIGNARTGIRWTLTSCLEDLDFADDIYLLASNRKHMQNKTTKLCETDDQIGLKINSKKTKVMSINAPTNPPVSMYKNEAVEEVDEFSYLGSIGSNDNGTSKEIKSRIKKARVTFCQLKNIWKSTKLNTHTKLKIYKSNVKSVLLYGAEIWRITNQYLNILSVFHNNCLRRICKIYWRKKISNRDLHKETSKNRIESEICNRRWKWIGHVLRKEAGNITKTALRWTPEGKRKKGRPKETYRRTIEKELKKQNCTWKEAEKIAKDREEWKSFVLALCDTNHEEER